MSFGFNRALCFRLNVIEWIVTALISAFGAIFGTYISGALIYKSSFGMTYQANFTWLFITLFIILVVVTSIGLFFSKQSLQSSVKQLMTD